MLLGWMMVHGAAFAALTAEDEAWVRGQLFGAHEDCGVVRIGLQTDRGAACPPVYPDYPGAVCVARLVNACTYRDDDGDGADASVDCDDADPTVSPFALEVCGDAIDEDCSGTADPCAPLGGATVGDADVTWTTDIADSSLGSATAAAGDADSDGHADVLLGAPSASADGRYGGVFVVAGDTGGALPDAGVWLYGASGEWAGYAVAGAGDVDRDGYDDLLIGGWGAYGDVGAAWLVRGPVTADAALSDSYATFSGEGSDDHAGFAVAGAGDVDADGFPDLVIGAEGSDAAAYEAGAAYLVTNPTAGLQSLATAAARWTGEASYGGGAGTSVAGAGDVTGDGVDDVLVGARYVDGPGAAYLLAGGPFGAATASGSLADADAKLAGDGSGALAGFAGDVDHDGYDDLLIGAGATTLGAGDSAAWLFFGGP